MLYVGWFPLVLLFQLFLSLYQSFNDCSERTPYTWCHRHFHVPSFFQFSSKVLLLFAFLQFYPRVSWNGKVHYGAGSLFFLLTITRSDRMAKIRWSVCISNHWEVCASHFSRRVLGCAYTTCSDGQIQPSCPIPCWLPSVTGRV